MHWYYFFWNKLKMDSFHINIQDSSPLRAKKKESSRRDIYYFRIISCNDFAFINATLVRRKTVWRLRKLLSYSLLLDSFLLWILCIKGSEAHRNHLKWARAWDETFDAIEDSTDVISITIIIKYFEFCCASLYKSKILEDLLILNGNRETNLPSLATSELFNHVLKPNKIRSTCSE